MDKLKELLGDLYEQVQTKLGNTKIIIDNGTAEKPEWIPSHRLSEVVAEKKTLSDQIKQYESDIASLKEKANGNETLTQKISEIQTANENLKKDFEANQAKLKKEYAVKESLMNSGVEKEQYRNLLLKEVDLSKVELDESGSIRGWDSTIKTLKETYSPMFGEVKIAGQAHQKGQQGGEVLYTREQVASMSQSEVSANLEKVNKSIASWKK